MKLVFYSITLNHHQAPVAEELYKELGDNYVFVELSKERDDKGGNDDFSQRPYLLKAWECEENSKLAMELACSATCCVFSGILSLPFMLVRMKLGLLSFDMSERWLKRGILNLFSPVIFKFFTAYHINGWKKKKIYKLCCGAFVAKDQKLLGTFYNKCYKWGYFTRVGNHRCIDRDNSVSSKVVSLMWCARFLKLKHPELPILLAKRLKEKGYNFTIDMYGNGECLSLAKEFAIELDVFDVVRFCGNKPNRELLNIMQEYDIFLFTSDKNEGWGAVANESMSNGCALVASSAIGAVPYLVRNRENGCVFQAPITCSSFSHPDMKSLASLCDCVEWLLLNPEKMNSIRNNALSYIHEEWSPKRAATNLLQLICDLEKGIDSTIITGPCSKA